MKLVCISDTHLAHNFTVPDGDILVHAGDLTGNGTYLQIAQAGKWLASLPHKHKIVIAGNHDFLFERDINLARLALGDGQNGVTYLQDSGVEIEGLRFWGSPWTPRFYDWAFQLDGPDEKRAGSTYDRLAPRSGRGRTSEEHWARLEPPIDILVTHGPPYGILDKLQRGDRVGDKWLLDAVDRVLPRLHIFGHIHCSAGQFHAGATHFINAAICDEFYDPTNQVITVEI